MKQSKSTSRTDTDGAKAALTTRALPPAFRNAWLSHTPRDFESTESVTMTSSDTATTTPPRLRRDSRLRYVSATFPKHEAWGAILLEIIRQQQHPVGLGRTSVAKAFSIPSRFEWSMIRPRDEDEPSVERLTAMLGRFRQSSPRPGYGGHRRFKSLPAHLGSRDREEAAGLLTKRGASAKHVRAAVSAARWREDTRLTLLGIDLPAVSQDPTQPVHPANHPLDARHRDPVLRAT